MRNNSCRKCGYKMHVNQNCPECKKAIEFICYKCNINTDKEIHSDCVIQNVLVKV